KHVRPQSEQAREILAAMGTTILGVVVNGVGPEGSRYNYRYYQYGYGYRYGYRYGYQYGFGHYAKNGYYTNETKPSGVPGEPQNSPTAPGTAIAEAPSPLSAESSAAPPANSIPAQKKGFRWF